MEESKTRRYQPPKDIKPEHQELMTKIGAKLTELRKRRNITSSGLAKEVGISRNAYHQMEAGKVYCNLLSLWQVLDFHNMSAKDFFTDL